MITIANKFNFGQIVYLKTDTEQSPLMVVEMYIGCVNPDHKVYTVAYKVVSGTRDYIGYEMEFSDEKDTLITL